LKDVVSALRAADRGTTARYATCGLSLTVTETEAAAIRAAFDQGGEFSAAVEFRRLFSGVTNNAEALECTRTIATWKPLTMNGERHLGQGRGRTIPNRGKNISIDPGLG
jgi:hypothetical protein